MRRLVGLLAAVSLLWPAFVGATEPWKVGVLIFRETNVTAKLDGRDVAVQATMEQTEIDQLMLAAREFARLVGDWSGGVAEMSIAEEPRVVSAPLEKVSVVAGPRADDDYAYVYPGDADPELTNLLTSGIYDAVLVFWHAGPDLRLSPNPGAALYTDHAGKRIIYAVLPLNSGVLTEPVRGEAIVHEWLHGVDDHYKQYGYLVPDSDHAGSYGYDDANGAGTLGGFESFYRDILRGRVRRFRGPEYSGVSAAVWSAGTIHSPLNGEPKPPQLVSPLDGACAEATPTLSWAGPSEPGVTWEVTIESTVGEPLFTYTRSVDVPSGLDTQSWEVEPEVGLAPGRRYHWRVSSFESGIPSAEPDELEFVVADRPPAPTISPSSGPISSAGVTVHITSSTPDAEIRYTLDGSTPTELSPLFPAGGVRALPAQDVQAIAIAPGGVCGSSSPVALASYTPPAPYVVTTTDLDGPGSISEALLAAGSTPGRDVIEFAISGSGPHRIYVTSPLGISDPVFIDGGTQPGYMGTPVIELWGGYLAGVPVLGAGGIFISAGDSHLSGLSLTGFGDYGISIAENGGNQIDGCWIGVRPDGTKLGNRGPGISILSPLNQIGGVGPRNLISGNGTWGIEISGSRAFGNRVVNNYIGTNPAGTVRFSNDFGGILIDNAPFNRIGGADPEAGNLISGNGFSGNSGDGIALANAGAIGNVVEGNRIGTNAAGTADLGNSRFGVNISITSGAAGASASGNVIGGVEPGAGNVISGNDATGIVMLSNFGAGGGSNRVQGNFIGTDVYGMLDLGNGSNGVSIARVTPGGPTPSGNLIGGKVSGARNLISGNTFDGVAIIGGSPGGNDVQGNYIGTDIQGIFPIANGRSGVRLNTNSALIDGASNNRIGGTSFGAGNVITGNLESGVAIVGNAIGAAGNRIQGNRIGVSSTLGSAAGNGPDGVLITTAPLGGFASGNLIGGTGLGQGNVIGGHTGAGIRIEGSGASGNVVQGNYVGIDGIGNPHPNLGPGVRVDGPSNWVGGGTAARNVIAANGGPGVLVSSGAGNRVQTNSIDANGGLGIELTGGNPGAIPPVLASAVPSHGTIVRGTLTAAPLSTYTVELFRSPVCDPSGAGEGARYLGAGPLSTDATGTGQIAALVTATVPLGEVVTAIVTADSSGSTSAFSNCVAPGAPPPGDPDGDGFGPGDNCPAMPGFDQSDVGGVGSSLPDGNGDVCQCGDIDDDGLVSGADVSLYREHLVNPGAVPLLGPAALKCSTIGSGPSICNLSDVVALRRALAARAPGVAQVCEAATL